MTEWGVVGVIVVLLGLIAGIGGPILKLSSNITRMSTILDRLDKDHAEDMRKNSANHEKLWNHNKKQDARMDDHDRRILTLEHK